MKEALQDCLAKQDIVPLISTTVDYDPHTFNNGHYGFMLRHEYEGIRLHVHIGCCFDPNDVRAALSGKSKISAYTSLDALLADWRVD